MGFPRRDAARSARAAALVAALCCARLAGAAPLAPVAVRRLEPSAPSPQAGDGFGTSVAVDADTLVVGSPGEDHAGSDEGAAYVFVRPLPGAEWALAAKLVAAGPNPFGGDERFGSSVAVDGDVIVVGAPAYDLFGASSDEGVAFVFVKPPGGWAGTLTSAARLQASNPNPFGHNVRLGPAVDLSGDTIAVGAEGYDLVGASSDEGVAFVFVEPAGGWSGVLAETAQLRAATPDPFHADEFFASAVAIEGDVAAVGARSYDLSAAGSNEGALFLFERPAAGWSGTLVASPVAAPPGAAPGDELGNALALDGDALVAGAQLADAPGAGDAGAAHVYTLPIPAPAPVPGLHGPSAALTAALLYALGWRGLAGRTRRPPAAPGP